MRLFLGILVLSNVIVSVLYGIMNMEFGGGDIKEMLIYNGIWTIFLSVISLGIWLIEPYCI